jgi:hypothetical protein
VVCPRTSDPINRNIVATRFEGNAIVLVTNIDAFDSCVGALADIEAIVFLGALVDFDAAVMVKLA